MVKFVKGALLATVAGLVLTGPAIASHDPDINAAEFKCQQSVNKAGGKFVGSKSKCISKCATNAWKVPPVNPFSDCFPPYGGATLCCIEDSTLPCLGLGKGAENKFSASIKKACDPVTKPGTDCPECYNGGDCSSSGYATDQVTNIENQVDSFVPAVLCETTGADAFEQKCQNGTAKALSKLVGSVNKCYDKCIKNADKGIGTFAACLPPASEPLTVACIAKADGKSIKSVDKACAQSCYTGTCTDGLTVCVVNSDCGPQANKPDCGGPDTYPTGADWTNLVEIAISGNTPVTYCGSPSGAFIE